MLVEGLKAIPKGWKVDTNNWCGADVIISNGLSPLNKDYKWAKIKDYWKTHQEEYFATYKGKKD